MYPIKGGDDMPIVTNGIFLPNGMFMPNCGDGHAKNAWRFCEKHEQLRRIADESYLNADEFLITAGCCILAGYKGVRCFKMAENNSNEYFLQMISSYEIEKFEIWKYWKIDDNAKNILEQVVDAMPKMQLTKKETSNMKDSLFNKRGFLWGGKWYSVGGKGHDHKAMLIIDDYKRIYPDENWKWYELERSAKDFLVLRKKAIQIGCSGNAHCIIAAGMYYSREDLEKIKAEYNLNGYEIHLIWS